LQNELEILTKRDFCHPDWAKKIQSLIKGELAAKLNTGEVFLIRLGRYGDAETKTLSKVAQIKILEERDLITRKQKFSFQQFTKTIWLAAEHPATCRLDMLPFGWALVEINPQQDLPELKAWCAAQVHPDMTVIHAQHAQARAEFALEKQQRIDAEKQKVAEAEAREQAKQARLAAKANMTDNQCAVTELADAIAKRAEQLRGGKEKQNGDFHSRAKKLVEQAKAAGNWTDDEKTALKNLVMQDLPQVVENMSDAKEQRKRFKLNDL
jgi:CRISPR-associated protein Csm5